MRKYAQNMNNESLKLLHLLLHVANKGVLWGGQKLGDTLTRN